MTTPKVTVGPYVTGEKPPPLQYTFQDSAGAAIDLTGYTARFVYREKDGTASTVNAAVSSPAAGQVTYVWSGVEFMTAGHYQAEFWAGDGGATLYASWLIEFEVRTAVGPVPAI